MQLTNYGINFYLYVISRGKFRTDLRNLFRGSGKQREHKESAASSIENIPA